VSALRGRRGDENFGGPRTTPETAFLGSSRDAHATLLALSTAVVASLVNASPAEATGRRQNRSLADHDRAKARVKGDSAARKVR